MSWLRGHRCCVGRGSEPPGFSLGQHREQPHGAGLVSVKPVVMDYVGSGLVAGYSVVHDKSGPPRSIVVADLNGGRRTVAASINPAVAARMQAEEMRGAPITLNKEGYRLSA